ncbi:helix-turn-helix domain-containing protein [Paenibacillus hodogayensis]|uniref:Helix-turn-helix domain-containing protein n=1 Tax=Paenibacillus hodogayensis TaxID=279208 RepID=A0ABV5VVA7_9BACL
MHTEAIDTIQIEVISHYYSKERSSFNFAQETYAEWALLACEEGKFHFQVAEQSGEVRAGEAVLCPPGEALHRRALTTLAFHFATFRLRAFQKGEAVDFPYRGKLSFQNSVRSLSTLASLRESMGLVSPRYTEHLIADLLYQYIGEVAVRHKERQPRDPAIREALRCIRDHAFDHVSMQLAASRAGLSQSQFTRKFQKEMGISPVKYLTQLRLQKAKLLLTETDDSLETIAERCGYQNAFYLSRVFSKEIRLSPSQYRSTHRV